MKTIINTETFITAKFAQTPAILMTWYDDDTLYELAKQSIADDIDRLTNDELAKGYCQFINEKSDDGSIAVTNPERYKTRIINLQELGSAICGIRFAGMDIHKPFINLAVTTHSITIEGLVQAVPFLQKEFADFNAKRIRVFIPNNSDDNLNELDAINSSTLTALNLTATKDKILIGNTLQALIGNQKKQTLSEQGFEIELIDFNNQPKFFENYQQGYGDLIASKPEFINYTFCDDYRDLCEIGTEGGFNFILKHKGQFAGLLSLFGSHHHFAGVKGLYFNEKFVIPSLHGQGFGRQFESWVIQTLIDKHLVSPDTVLFGDIDFNNKGSLHSAINNGRVEIGRWLWIE